MIKEVPKKHWGEDEKNLLGKVYQTATEQELINLFKVGFNAIQRQAGRLHIYRSDTKLPLTERFNNSFIPEPNSGCWLWIAAPGPDGYTQISYGGKSIRGHRVSWIIHKGEIPPGMDVLHKCDVRSCVNPDHLFLGTDKDNVRDCCKKDRHSYGMRHPSSKLTNDAVKKSRKTKGRIER